ncbi:unnamed protein product [Rotaria sordida]|uniref:c-SKI SMAD4-binding domain-containing protein n=1 Tax=Rotaria sordida TaxID=392033 RepID=A0A814LDX6_9BILA|nr:unnamed protein product [Rotaria sordida]
MSNDDGKNKTIVNDLISMSIINEPLMIVLDNDDDSNDDDSDDVNDKYEFIDLTTSSTTITQTNSNNILLNEKNQQKEEIITQTISTEGEQLQIELTDCNHSLVNTSKNTSKIFRHSSKTSNKLTKSNRSIRNIAIDTNFMRQKTHQPQRTKPVPKRKKVSTSNSIDNHKDFSIDDHPIDCILSHISFEQSTILTISRMGSIYYCVEDLYIKAFSSLCTFDEFIYLLEGIDRNILKTVTLSEKISIEQQNPLLKTFNRTRYHLLTINSFDYITKLKQLLNKYEKSIEKIFNEMPSHKQTPMSIPLNNKISTSSISTEHMETNNNNEQSKYLTTSTEKQQLNELSQFGIFIPHNNPGNCNRNSTNETLSSISIPDMNSKIIAKSALKKRLSNNNNNNNEFQSEQNSNNNLTQHSHNISENCSSSLIPNTSLKQNILKSLDIDTNHSSIPKNSSLISPTTNLLHHLHRSKSMAYNKKQIKRLSSRSSSLPSVKFHVKDNIILKSSLTTKKPIDLIDDNYRMPLIVNVEENVEINNQNIKSDEKLLSYSQQSSINNTMSSILQKKSIPSSDHNIFRSSSLYLKPITYDVYYEKTYPSSSSSSSYEKPKELLSNHENVQSKLISILNNNLSQTNLNSSSSTMIPFVQQRINNNNNRNDNSYSLISEQQPVSIPCYLPCCSGQLTDDKFSISKNISSNQRMIHSQYTVSPSLKCNLSQTLKNSNSSSSLLSLSNSRKLRRFQTNPYPSSKHFFPQTSIPSHYSQNSFISEIQSKPNIYHTVSPNIIQNCATIISPPNTPNGLTLPSTFFGSIDISQAIVKHSPIDMDKIPKLVVRHTKTYLNKKIDTMGQLFPTWFNEPDYRCIHCFTCDQVFTPQQFMTHVDDEQMINIQPLHMTSIQLLTSEKLSDYKVALWNEFCTNLTNYASKFAELGKKKCTKNH